jgi:hypothetical protein
MKSRIIALIGMLLVSGQSGAWIAYGFKSGMSRFDVAGHLSDRPSFVITEELQRTLAGPGDDRRKYEFIYCFTPQKLYLMKYRLADSRVEFDKAKRKFERRYGKPEVLDGDSADAESANPGNADISLIWHLNEFETILLMHGANGTSAEFQDVSVCQ